MATTAADRPNQTPALVTIIAGAVTVIASFLPWVSAKVSALGQSQSITVSGTDASDGWITAVCGAIALVVAGMFYAGRRARWQGILGVIAGAVALVVGLIDFSDASSAAELPANLQSVARASSSASIGLYLVLLGGAGIVVGAIMMIRGRATGDGAIAAPPPDSAPAAPPPATPE